MRPLRSLIVLLVALALVVALVEGSPAVRLAAVIAAAFVGFVYAATRFGGDYPTGGSTWNYFS